MRLVNSLAACHPEPVAAALARSVPVMVQLFFALLLVLGNSTAQAVTPLSDRDMEDVTGQALFFTNTSTTGSGSSAITFYTIGLDAKMALNANIQNMQLGCGGINGMNDCDIDVTNFSLSGTPGVTAGCTAGLLTTASCDAILTRPAVTLAIQNNSSPFRQVVGFQLGAQNISGELGFGSFNKFSGYLSAVSNIDMTAQTNLSVTCNTGSCPGTLQTSCPGGSTCSGSGGTGFLTGAPSGCCSGYSGVSQYASGSSGSLGLNDDYACTLLICAGFDSLTVNTTEQKISNIPIVLQGNRQTQVILPGSSLQLGTLVANVSSSLSVNQSEGLPSGLVNLILPLITGSMEQSIYNQLGAALTPAKTGLAGNSNQTSGTYTEAQLNSDSIPYNVSNLHLVDVNSNQFGLSFENQAIQWPGYVASVGTGWAFYLPNAFTLNITQPLSTFTSNIVGGAAAAGNIVSLQSAPSNCFGNYKFC